MEQKNKIHTSDELEALYRDAEGVDQEVFAEMRSNVLLIAGEHYNKKYSNFYRRIRDSKELNEAQKLRLTKNHVQRIHKIYVNNILSLAPGVGFEAKNEDELQDQKAAQLHHSVWRHAFDKNRLDERTDQWCNDFCAIGEIWVKLFWDPNAGDIASYPQKMDEEGNPEVDEFGQPVGDEENPTYSGAFVFEDIYGFNLLRPAESTDPSLYPWVCNRKMVNRKKFQKQYAAELEGKDKGGGGSEETFVIFDQLKNAYRRTKEEMMIKEFFFRPCPQYPEGYFFIKTKEFVVAKGELPGGLFPIVGAHYDRFPTAPRGRGPVKIMRPYQAEINRASSKIAEHQITLGDDKIMIQNGTEVSPGVALPGVRSINYTGSAPVILSGRDGSQYLQYLEAQIAELYSVMGIPEDAEAVPAQLDPFALLFKSATQKKKFQRYARRFERFLIDLADLYIRLAKIHLPDQAVIYAVGKNEQVNIPEFRNSEDLCYQIKIIPQADDIETKLGRQMMLNQVLQYVGPQLQKDDIGKLIRSMPYANAEETFKDLTMDYDSATNDILALDRGEMPPIHEYDNHVYTVKRLVSRMRQADFKMLDPRIQQGYAQVLMQHQQMQVVQEQKIQAAEQGYIPTGGYMVTADIYVADPVDPSKTKRARIPYESVQWLIQRLESQGQSLENLETMNRGAMAQMSDMMLQNQNQLPAPNGMGVSGY